MGRAVMVLVAGIAAVWLLLGVSAFRGGGHRAPAPRPVVRVAPPHDPAPWRVVPPLRPPQFLVVSFDGSGGAKLWPYWRSVARRAGARFTFFVSGVYLLDPARRRLYRPPRHAPGSSDIGFAFEPVRGMARQIALAYREGDEIGTHFNGHFCAPYPGNVGEWTTADWRQELAQFDRLLFHADVRLPFGPDEVIGGRTPCLQGDRRALFPALAARGFRYDASGQAVLGTWPWREGRLWELPLLEVPFVGHTYRVVSMDYNLFANQVASGTPSGSIEAQTYDTLWGAFEASYRGNRAPLSFANHFETWEGGAYDRALARVVLRACRLPEVECVPFRDLVTWLDAQPRARLRRYEAGRFPRLRAGSTGG